MSDDDQLYPTHPKRGPIGATPLGAVPSKGTGRPVILPEPLDLDVSWKKDAACADGDPDTWFPERGEDTSYALAVCATCPVISDCLEYAIAARIEVGIWGGKSGKARRKIARMRRNNAA